MSKNKKKSKRSPDHDDADLVIRLYDLRREPVMRAARDAIIRDFWPRNYDEFIAVTAPEHPLNTAFRQVGTYWEMVYGMAHHGIAAADYLVENSGEGLFLYAKVAPFVERYREEVWPSAFVHAGWAATKTDAGRRLLAAFTQRIEQVHAADA